MIVCCRRAASRWARAACTGPYGTARAYSTDFLQSLINWEQVGIPSNAGTAQSSAFDLGRMHRLLHKLGNPHLQLKAVHIAGSKGGQTEQSRMHIILVPLPSSHISCVKESGGRSSSQRACMHVPTGKGSTSMMVTEALRAAGFKVGSYTSPHMQHVSERISTHANGHMSPEAFDTLVQQHEAALIKSRDEEQGALSHFEALTALAFRCVMWCRIPSIGMETCCCAASMWRCMGIDCFTGSLQASWLW